MRESQYKQGNNEVRGAAESDVAGAANQESDPNGSLHAFLALTRDAPRYDRPDRRAYATRCKQDTDSGGSTLSDRKDSFAKNRKESQDATTKSPRRFDE